NIRGGHEHIGGVNIQLLVFFQYFVLIGVKGFYFLYFIPEKMNSEGMVGITRKNVHHISLYPKITVFKIGSRSGVQALYQLMQEFGPWNYLVLLYSYNIFLKFHRISYAVQTGNRCHDQYIPSPGQ